MESRIIRKKSALPPTTLNKNIDPVLAAFTNALVKKKVDITEIFCFLIVGILVMVYLILKKKYSKM